MKSSKRHVILLSLIFLLKCLSKSFFIIQFSAIEIRWVFSHPKLTISWLQWLEKKGGLPVLVGELEPFFNWQSSISRQILYVFNVSLHERVLNYAQKGCAMQLWGITFKCHFCEKLGCNFLLSSSPKFPISRAYCIFTVAWFNLVCLHQKIARTLLKSFKGRRF